MKNPRESAMSSSSAWDLGERDPKVVLAYRTVADGTTVYYPCQDNMRQVQWDFDFGRGDTTRARETVANRAQVRTPFVLRPLVSLFAPCSLRLFIYLPPPPSLPARRRISLAPSSFSCLILFTLGLLCSPSLLSTALADHPPPSTIYLIFSVSSPRRGFERSRIRS